MIRSKLITLFLAIMIVLTPLSTISAQTMPITQTDLETIWIEYQILKKLMPELGTAIVNLQTNLTVSEESRRILELKVIALENQLAKARSCVATSDEYTTSLENQLIELEMSLENTKTIIRTDTDKYETRIVEIVTSYDTEIARLKSQRNTLLIISIAEALLLALGVAVVVN